jgi:Mrp family chromosome partitioning ATPase
MNTVREGWQAPTTQVKPPGPLWLALHEMTAQLLGRAPDKPIRQLMLVGAAPLVGTSFVAGHWAALLAPVYPNVLLIECRADAPAALAANPIPAAPAAPGRITRARVAESTCLTMLSAGNPTQWQQAFDLVLWDLPPLTVSPAALVLARHVNGVVLVAQAQRTRRQVALHSALRLQESGGSVVGVVLNRTVNFIPRWIYRLL